MGIDKQKNMGKLRDAALRTQNGPNNSFEYSDDEIECALGWLKGEIRATSIAKVWGHSRQNIYSRLPVMLRQAYRKGMLKIT